MAQPLQGGKSQQWSEKPAQGYPLFNLKCHRNKGQGINGTRPGMLKGVCQTHNIIPFNLNLFT